MIAGVAAVEVNSAYRRSVETLAPWVEQTLATAPAGGPAAWLASTGKSAVVTLPRATSNVLNGNAVALAWEGVLYPAAAPVSGASAPAATRPVGTGEPVEAGDAWTVARAFADGATRCLDDIVGDFALAAWDGRQRQLLLATDPFALRPLHYAFNAPHGLLAFASDTRLLRKLWWVGDERDDDTVLGLLLDETWRRGHTAFRNIRVLPAGCSIAWQAARGDREPVLPTRHWGQTFAPTGVRSRQELLDAFEHAMRRAVDERLPRDTATAILMSGGYDSTALAGVAAALARGRSSSLAPHTISAVFPGLPCDESARIELARAHNGLPHATVPALDCRLTLAAILAQVQRSDSPLFNQQHALLQAELDAAAACGATSIMTGVGGDELVQDLEYRADLLAQRGVLRIPGMARSLAAASGNSIAGEAVRLWRVAAPPRLKQVYRSMRRVAAAGGRDPAVNWLQPGMAARAARRQQLPENATGPVFESQFQAGRWAQLQDARTQYGHHATLQAMLQRGFACSFPFLDRRLFELVLGTNPAFLPRTSEVGQYKPLLAEGLREHIPRALTRGRAWKVAFGSYNALQMHAALDEVEPWLMAGGCWKSEPYVSRSAAVEVIANFRRACQAGSGDAGVHLGRLGGIVGLEAWLRQL
jgi:asparagine synthase (glutamine-hydrolysing)